jgi:hypothetical protein
MPLATTITTVLTIAGIATAWVAAGAAWWVCGRGARDRARTLGHLAWVTGIVALLVLMAALSADEHQLSTTASWSTDDAEPQNQKRLEFQPLS